jgi:methyltransferase
MVNWSICIITVIIVAQRLVELALARRNRQWVVALGAVEYGARHYPLFFLIHGAWLLGWLTEALTGGPQLSSWWPAWLLLFGAAQALRYWCIHSLGHYWNTRILVVPGATAIRRGPYRYLPHPNYLAVALELAAVPMIFGCWLTAAAATAVNGILLVTVRIPQEEEALKLLR